MLGFDIYDNIAQRTGGDIYLGVVGPVRTGKSTFIKRFMEKIVLGKVDDENKLNRMVDELPQSADGRTIMTTQPKFVPNEAVNLKFDKVSANIRLIDCVGYLIEDVLGSTEDGKPRMVKTPWSEEEMPFQEAAEIGTDKVISDHSTVGIVVTTDGSISDISRGKYEESEDRVIEELKKIGKPFVVLLNSKHPKDADTKELRKSLEDKHQVPVIAVNCAKMSEDDINKIMLSALNEFPISSVSFDIPKWMRTLSIDHKIIAEMNKLIKEKANKVYKMCHYKLLENLFLDSEYFEKNCDVEFYPDSGKVIIHCKAKEGLYFKILSEECGNNIDDDYKLLGFVKKMSKAYIDYEGIRVAMSKVKDDGYGVVNPNLNELELDEPVLVKKGSQYGVKLKAKAPSYHIVKVDVKTEISPTIGNEQQSSDMIKSLLTEYESDKQKLWDTNMFGKPLNSLVKDDLSSKIQNMPIDTQKKIRKTMQRIVNEGKGGVLCILL